MNFSFPKTTTVGLNFSIQRLKIHVKMITLIAFSRSNELNLDDTIGTFVTNAANILYFKSLDHLIDLLTVGRLFAHITMAIIGI